MASYNRVILMGNLTRDPQVRYTPNQTAVTDLGLAINRTWYDKAAQQKREEVTFVDVTLWGRQAEVAGEYLSKGRSVLIEGRLQLDQWDDRESGQKRSKLKVVCENMTMVGGRSDGGGFQGGGGSQSTGSAPESSSPADDFYNSPASGPPDDEVPF
ncbi:MAG: single-stranded DNA-binding protein [Planctomycetaceae bacterium]